MMGGGIPMFRRTHADVILVFGSHFEEVVDKIEAEGA